VLNALISRLARDQRGGEVLEYAIIAGMIVAVALIIILSVGGKVVATWSSLNSEM
jgi:pilus assembly protein Flp/PilA